MPEPSRRPVESNEETLKIEVAIGGFGLFQRAQMKRSDPRISEMFHHLRDAIDVIEQIMLHPYSPPVTDAPTQPKTQAQPAQLASLDSVKLAYTIKELRTLLSVSRRISYG